MPRAFALACREPAFYPRSPGDHFAAIGRNRCRGKRAAVSAPGQERTSCSLMRRLLRPRMCCRTRRLIVCRRELCL